MRAASLPVPARHTREPMSDIGDFDIERRGVQEIETPPRQHPLPGAGGRRGREQFSDRHLTLMRGARWLPAQLSWRKQLTRWSVAMPVGWMKAETMVSSTNVKSYRAKSR